MSPRFRAAGAPIVFVRNGGGAGDPDERGTPGWKVHPALQPADTERVLVNKEFAGRVALVNAEDVRP